MNYISITLNTKKGNPKPLSLTKHNRYIIEKLFNNALEAQKVAVDKKHRKIAAQRLTETAVVELLENPGGLSKSDLLMVAESENLSATVLRIKNYLKKENKHTLEKHAEGGETYYKLCDSSD